MKLVIGFIVYGKLTVKYLPYFLKSVYKQSFRDFQIIAIDNSENKNNSNIEYIEKNYPEIKIEWAGKNIGFARAYNKMIDKAVKIGAEYFLVINPDIILDKNAFKILIDKISLNKNLASVCPKILKWDFENNKKTNIIDTHGIQLKAGLKFIDVGQGEIDDNKFNNIKILGSSGACGLYRLTALKKIKKNNQYFDELMFMYKEDCDLAYRLSLAGYNSECVNNAIVYHDRTVKAKGQGHIKIAINRKSKSKQSKKWSFLHQQIIFIKYWNLQNFKNKLAIILYEIKMIIFILLFEQYLLAQFLKLWRLKNNIYIYKKNN